MTVAQTGVPGASSSSATDGWCQLRGHGDRAGQRDAHAITVGLEVGHGGLPRVARAALGLVAMQRDGLRANRDRHLAAGQDVRDRERRATVEEHGPVAAGGAVEQVDADELGDVARGGTGRHVGRRARLGDAIRLR